MLGLKLILLIKGAQGPFQKGFMSPSLKYKNVFALIWILNTNESFRENIVTKFLTPSRSDSFVVNYKYNKKLMIDSLNSPKVHITHKNVYQPLDKIINFHYGDIIMGTIAS